MANNKNNTVNTGKNLRERDYKYDVILMNPPFDKDTHLDFFDTALDEITEKGAVVTVEPGSWLTQLKDKGKYTKADSVSEQIKRRTKGHVRSVELNNMNNEFNIANKTVCSITAVDFSRDYDKIKLERCGETSQVDTIYDCNLIGDYETVKSILNKCKVYKDHMIDHCINTAKYEDYENKGYYFLKYGNYMINSLGSGYGGTVKRFYADDADDNPTIAKTKFGSYYNAYKDVALLKSAKIEYNKVPKGIKQGTPMDSVYGTKEHLENWKYFCTHNKLPLFVNICLTTDENNNSREYLPWLVNKQYTDEEIYNLLGITKEEQKLIDETINKFEKNSNFAKNLFNANK